jgi:hypothetical protein
MQFFKDYYPDNYQDKIIEYNAELARREKNQEKTM